MRPLSYTQISSYRSCPLAYKLQYIDRLKRKERFYLSFGDVIHQCAEFFYKIPVPPPPSLEKLLEFYAANWISQGYESPEQEQQYKEYGQKLLADFWQIHHADFKMPLAVEQTFYVSIAEGITLTGKIDRVDKVDGGVAIVDYKTSKELFTQDHLEQDLQLTFYQLAAEHMWKMPVRKLTLYHLRSNTPCTCEPRRPERIKEARQIILNVADGIQAQEFPARENQFCDFCDFPEHCPYQKHRFAAAEPVRLEDKQILHGESANGVVEQYAALQAQKKDIEAQIEELRGAICAYCDLNGYSRLYGSEHAITYRNTERTGFDEEQVKAILEPTGLWPRVLKFDPALARALLDADYLNPDLRKKLAALKQITASFSTLTVKKLKSDEET